MANISGTNLVAPVVPFTTDDKYPTHLAQYGKGGWRSIQNRSLLNTIPTERIEPGMAVYCVENDEIYIYHGDSRGWEPFTTGGDSNSDEQIQKILNDINDINNRTSASEDNINKLTEQQKETNDRQTNLEQQVPLLQQFSQEYEATTQLLNNCITVCGYNNVPTFDETATYLLDR